MIEIKKENYTFTFKQPTQFEYKLAYSHLVAGQHYDAIDTLIVNCTPDTDDNIELRTNERLKMVISQDLHKEFFTFYTVNVYDTDETLNIEQTKQFNQLKKEHNMPILAVRLGTEQMLFFKTMVRADYKTLYDLLINDSISALEFIFKNMLLSDFDFSELKTFYSCMKLPDYLLLYKGNELKKN